MNTEAIRKDWENWKNNRTLMPPESVIDGMDALLAAAEDNQRLRQGLSRVATNIGNGSAASPEASIGFLCDAVPTEVKLVCDHLRQLLERAVNSQNQDAQGGPTAEWYQDARRELDRARRHRERKE